MNAKDIIEVLIHSSTKPLNQRDIDYSIDSKEPINIDDLIKGINKEYIKLKKGYRIERVSNGYQLLSLPEYHYYIERLQQNIKKPRFTKPSLETLSIIAYKQPIIKSEVEHIRGVNSSGVIKNLLEKGLITIKGRDVGIGRALLYTTTPVFLELFGLASLSDLPTLDELTQLVDTDNHSRIQNDED